MFSADPGKHVILGLGRAARKPVREEGSGLRESGTIRSRRGRQEQVVIGLRKLRLELGFHFKYNRKLLKIFQQESNLIWLCF